MPQKFRIKKDGAASNGSAAGTICYEFMGCDYGLSNDDTRALGIPHVSVTLDPAGGTPSFTVRKSALEKV